MHFIECMYVFSVDFFTLCLIFFVFGKNSNICRYWLEDVRVKQVFYLPALCHPISVGFMYNTMNLVCAL